MELTLEQALQKGIEAHKAGKVQEADQYYTAILKANSKHPDANHNMGVLAVGVSKVQEALPFFKTALEANPNIAQYWLSYVDALIKLDRLDDAKAVFDQAKSKGAKGDAFDQIEKRLGSTPAKNSNTQEPPQKELNALIKLYNENRLVQAFDEAQKLTKRYTKSLTLWNLMGASAAQIGQLDDAILAFEKAISIKPDYAEAYNNMGLALKDQGKVKEATEAYNKALSIQPDFADAYNNMGIALKDQGKLDEAIQAYSKALSIKPDNADAHYNIGIARQEQGEQEEAIEAYNKAVSIKPDYAEAYSNMGLILKDQGKLDKAIEVYKKAISMNHDYAEAYNNMGNALREQGKLDEAIVAYKKAISIKPDYTVVNYNMGLSLYRIGKYKEAASFFRKNNSSVSQTWLLKCLFELKDKSHFCDQLDYLIAKGENNSIIGSYTARSKIRYGINRKNPFCNEPLKHVLKIDLLEKCNFQDVFVEGAVKILNEGIVKNKDQSLLRNAKQTVGNVFGQMGQYGEKIQDIISIELENYKLKYRDSNEGLISSWPINYRLNGWIVKMKNGGAIKPHMHEEGWISGSVYINVPPKVEKDSGNLVVCVDNETVHKAQSKSLDVVTGSLCLFPSSLLHYTIPFESDEDRIVLAFDMIPNK